MATAACPGQDDTFSCSICLEEFTKPKLLPCFHTFCCKCIQQYIDNHGSSGTFNCPICRAETSIPTGGKADTFQTNFYLTASLAGRHSLPGIGCEFCVNPATMRCLECGENFCKTCVKPHAKSRASRDHHIVDIVEPETKHKVDTGKIFGSVVRDPPDAHMDGNVEFISSFTTGDTSTYVSSIVPCSGDRCWILQDGQSKLRLMDVHGWVVKTVGIGMNVYAMAGDPHGGLYVSCRDDKCIKYVSPQLEVSTVTTTGNHTPGHHDIVIILVTDSYC
jgi:hypothetical protein